MEIYRDTHQAVNYLVTAGVLSKETAHLSHVIQMCRLRKKNNGPKFVRFGRSVRYAQSALDDYIRGNSAEAQKELEP
jgi:hypothetical protein